MALTRFLAYVVYSRECPSSVNPARWAGMLRWYNTRIANGEPFIMEF